MSRGTIFTEAVGGGDRIWLDQLGLVQNLVHQTNYPGGDSQATWQMVLDPTAQHRAWDYGRVVGLSLGGGALWHGNMDNPTRGQSWQMLAIGRAAQPKQYVAYAPTSGNALNLNEVIDAAISRGLGLTRGGSLPTMTTTDASVPSASIRCDQAMEQVAQAQSVETYGKVDINGVLTMGPAPTTPSYLLFATTPGGGRNLSGFATDAFVIYQSASGVLSVDQRSAATRPFGRFESPVDKTALGLIPSTQADSLGDGFIARNGARAKYTNTFAVSPGQLTTLGGQAVDLATVRAGFLATVIMTDPDSAGEVVGAVIPRVLMGNASYDWDADVLTLTPVSTTAQDTLSPLLGAGSGLS